MKRAIVFLIAASVTLLCACAPKLAEGFDKDALLEAGSAVVGIVNEREYQKIIDMGRNDFAELLSAESLGESLNPVLDSLGEFKSQDSAMAIGVEANGEDMATVLIVCTYEKQKVTYRITFDIDMLLTGLYLQ